MRFALCAYTASNRDINLDIKRVEGYRKFCNKIWQGTRFAMMKLGTDFKPAAKEPTSAGLPSLYEKWILHRLNQAIVDVNAGFEDFNFTAATSAIFKFFWDEVCDVYIEVVKRVVDATDDPKAKESAREILYTVLDYAIRLMHPIMPFLTEELYQRLGNRPGDKTETVMLAKYPEPVPEWNHPEVEKMFESVNEVIKVVRSMALNYNLESDAKGWSMLVGIVLVLIILFVRRQSLSKRRRPCTSYSNRNWRRSMRYHS